MKVGITYYAEPSLFGSSRGQSALFLAEALEAAGELPVLISIGAMDWWPDATALENRFQRIHAKDAASAGFDLFVDIDALAAPFLRKATNCRVAALFRGSLAFQQLEKANYMNPSAQYTLEGVDEIWAYDILNPATTLPSLQTLFGDRPIRHIPFVWSPLCLKGTGRDVQQPPHLTQNKKVQLVIAEGNKSSASNCIVPFVGACRWLNETQNPRITKSLCILNGKQLETDAYFQRNIAGNVKGDVVIEYKDRVLYANLQGASSLVISHLRFQAMRPGLFDLAWLGIPFVHNSPFLQETGLAGNFYEDTSLEGMAAAIEKALQFAAALAAAERKCWAETVCSPAAAKPKLLQLLQQPLPLQATQQKPLSLLQRQQAAPLSSPTSPLHLPFPSKKILRIGFTDMWEGFAPDDNWFLDLLQQTATFLGHKEAVFLGVDGKEEECELLMFGPFGNMWESVSPEIPKVFFSGERIGDSRALADPRVSLFLTHSTVEDNKHMRVPLWLMFLNWFSPQPHLQRNPNSLPWKWVLGGGDADGEGERDFCAFVVSNPTNPVRNAAFETLNAYKPVASGGAYRNTIGGPIYHLYGGGGGGDVAKHAFLKKHKFCICYENSLAPGYVTEKLLHAKLAGCVPLYWGAPEAAVDFDPAGFVNLNGKEGDLLHIVQQLEADPATLQQMAATPALDAARLQKARETVFAVGRRLLQLCGLLQESAAAANKPANVIIDPSVSVAAAMPQEPAASSEVAAAAAKSPLFVTFATKAYLPSLENILHSWKALHKNGEKPHAIVYLGHDVSKDAEAMLLSKYSDWVSYRRLPAESPVVWFPDFFEPKMFGWKLWILKTICEEAALANRLVLYSDSGATWIDFPKQMLETAQEKGICLLTDNEQINRNWCSAEMIREMEVNEKELDQQQLMAAFQAFVAGMPLALEFYKEAFAWGSKKSCLFGDWCSGIDEKGRMRGHRHDQSICSILSLRYKISCIVGNPLMNLVSLRKAYQKGAAVYHHRGRPVRHQHALPGVDDIWVVSLDRRADRWASWKEAHPSMASSASRLCAIDGKALTLTPALYTLFEQNDFHWKKSVTGCALSHILLWCQLVSDHPDVQNYLIFEDDHRFKDPAWPARFEEAMRKAPADAELLYFGGVLPRNKAAYAQCVEPVNDIWGTIRPNPCFSPDPSVLAPVFHFCAYSYLLTRKGAEKLLAVLRTQGCGTSIDHFLGWPEFGLKKYVMRDLMATCFQEEDPVYVNSQFDDMKRIDAFDSDIWNNDQCFTPLEYGTFPKHQSQAPLWKCILDVLQQAPANIQTHRTLREKAVNGIKPMEVFTYADAHDGLMEKPWLTQLYPGISFQPFSLPAVLSSPDPWLLFARPHIDFWNSVVGELEKHKKGFSILHLSDEGCLDDLGAYASPFCKKVIRNYVRPDLDTEVNKKVCLLPLGFAAAHAAASTPAFQSRELVWSFHGTRWFDRPQQLASLQTAALQPYSLKFQDAFLDPSMTPKKEFSALLLRSKFAPIPRGNNCETFRLYEALEHGCIPLYVRTPGDELFWRWLTEHLELVELRSWDAAAKMATHLLENPAKAEMYRQGLCKQWNQWKLDCKLFL